MNKRYRWFNCSTYEVISSIIHPNPSDHDGIDDYWNSDWIPVVDYFRCRWLNRGTKYYDVKNQWHEYANKELERQFYSSKVWNGWTARNELTFDYAQYLDPDIENPKMFESVKPKRKYRRRA